ncbi:unnamed protein product [Thelazia callipaeda]|uniref:Col_cuticle_N domain-containing protein n=1 Tax=Thelazia callipaeda TaxID=103827 RepID=A0A0N5CN45_THECL|nr:unnamed protein product [Thelazia callipaeda]
MVGITAISTVIFYFIACTVAVAVVAESNARASPIYNICEDAERNARKYFGKV